MGALTVGLAGCGDDDEPSDRRAFVAGHERYVRACFRRISAREREEIRRGPGLRDLPYERRVVEQGRLCGRVLARRQLAERQRTFALSRAQRATAKRIVERSAALRPLLEGRPHRTRQDLPWTYGSRTIGVVVEVTMDPPLRDKEVTLPVFCNAPGGKTYQPGTARTTIDRATDFLAFVDLGRERLVGVKWGRYRGRPYRQDVHTDARFDGPCEKTRD